MTVTSVAARAKSHPHHVTSVGKPGRAEQSARGQRVTDATKLTYILAASYPQAKVIAAQLKLFDWRYIVDANQVRGLEGVRFVVCPEQAVVRRDYAEVLRRVLAAQDCVVAVV